MMNDIKMNKAKQIKMTVEAILDSMSADWAQMVLGTLGDLNSLTMKQLRGIEQLADLANDEEEQQG